MQKRNLLQVNYIIVSTTQTFYFYLSNFREIFANMNSESSFELDEHTKLQWYKIVFATKKMFGIKPDMNALLFLIGMRELGITREFSKEEKLDLMHIATCKLMSYDGYYEFEKTDEDGWPHYKLLKKAPYIDIMNQENILKRLIVKYFEESDLIE